MSVIAINFKLKNSKPFGEEYYQTIDIPASTIRSLKIRIEQRVHAIHNRLNLEESVFEVKGFYRQPLLFYVNSESLINITPLNIVKISARFETNHHHDWFTEGF